MAINFLEKVNFIHEDRKGIFWILIMITQKAIHSLQKKEKKKKRKKPSQAKPANYKFSLSDWHFSYRHRKTNTHTDTEHWKLDQRMGHGSSKGISEQEHAKEEEPSRLSRLKNKLHLHRHRRHANNDSAYKALIDADDFAGIANLTLKRVRCCCCYICVYCSVDSLKRVFVYFILTFLELV